MADANSANGSDLEAQGTTDPEPQHKGGEPTPALTRMDHGDDEADADSAEYANLLDFYDSSFRNIAEGEVVKGTVLKVTDSEVIVDVGLQVGRHHRGPGVPGRERPGHRSARRHRGRAPGAHRGPRRLRRSLPRKSGEDEDLGRRGEGLCRQEGRHRPRHRADQGRPGGGHRRAGVPARLAGGRAPGPEPGRPARPGTADARHQGEQEAREHRPVAEGPPRGRERGEEEAHARDARRGQGAARRGEEHHRLRRVHRPGRHRRPAAHHGHVVGPRRAPVRAVQGQRRDRRDRAEVRPGHRARVARATSSCRPTRGRRWPSGTR